ncbi:uncharacterized protein CC84DRAFT_633250 [Paraphaeosphaeria sporulosa]|uniref:Uncharacterized protein n=1 Tax=Paraphaeosphaeria sporulosa TaxID=1460663 RepID=A0A177CJL6_9PLEO|nr:uncharacterized protein CC84DRAFT_633250 [Paraphaeosphaeria sporulosa]OAG07020.1 hypothetical protein CC84DRAFT_633250 [Paraphaeosphaeria sporulosa]
MHLSQSPATPPHTVLTCLHSASGGSLLSCIFSWFRRAASCSALVFGLVCPRGPFHPALSRSLHHRPFSPLAFTARALTASPRLARLAASPRAVSRRWTQLARFGAGAAAMAGHTGYNRSISRRLFRGCHPRLPFFGCIFGPGCWLAVDPRCKMCC